MGPAQNPSICTAEAGLQDSLSHSEFEASLSYKTCLNLSLAQNSCSQQLRKWVCKFDLGILKYPEMHFSYLALCIYEEQRSQHRDLKNQNIHQL